MDEKRQNWRLRSLKSGLIIFGLAPSIDCVIRNISETGAELIVTRAISLPDEFELLIKPERIKRNCQITWREHRSRFMTQQMKKFIYD